MRQFLKLCEIVQSYGVTSVKYSKDDPRHDPKDVTNSIGVTKNTLAEPMLLQARPIVFMEEAGDISEFRNRLVTGVHEGKRGLPTEHKKLDAPFKVFSIERINGPLVSTDVTNNKPHATEINCVVVEEVEPKKYRFLTLLTYPQYKRSFVLASNSEGALVESYINRLNTERVGFENTRQSIKIGSGKEKTNRRIRKIVYVCPKKEYEKQNEKLGKQIDWSHRWLVRGHWRKCEGTLGKDREGLHCIPNYTWVVDHVKGPEDKILIADKTRLVKKTGEQIHV